MEDKCSVSRDLTTRSMILDTRERLEIGRKRCGRLFQSRATASQAEKKTRQLEKVIDDGEQKLTELMDELKEAHDEERRMNAEITKLRLQLDETNSATDFARKDCKKLSGACDIHFLTVDLLFTILHFILFLKPTLAKYSSKQLH